MDELWGWTKVGLVLGGAVVGLVGLVWHRTARLAKAFGRQADEMRGFWVMVAGFAMLAAGPACFYFKL